VAATVGEGLGEGVGEGFVDFGSWSRGFSRCLTTVFISACGAGFFLAFFGSTFSEDFFSLFLFTAGLSFGGGAPRESPDVLPDVVEDATAPNFSPGFRSATLRGLVATCGRGGGFAVTADGVRPVAFTVLNATGLSGVVVLGAGA
jgi:hypothetical protein